MIDEILYTNPIDDDACIIMDILDDISAESDVIDAIEAN